MFYKPKGASIEGTDYNILPGLVTIPAGAATAKIKVRAFNTGTADGTKELKLKLVPPSDGTYTIGTPVMAKIRISSPPNAP